MTDVSYRFGPFLVDRGGFRVLRDGQPVVLTPKLLDLLLHFLDQPGQLVTKEALLDALWPDANVTENALAQAMSELRQALGDEPAAPQFIKTIARRGYRFIAAVQRIEGPAADRPARDASAAMDDGEARTIAVLDFQNVSGNAECAWLSAGIAETVTCDLRALNDFKVVDRRLVIDSARRADGRLDAIAADLGARLAILGSFQRSGARIRITARLVDVVSGEALADAKVDGPIDTIFELQDQIVTSFAADLGMAIRRDGSRIGVRDTPSLDAYRAFTEGWLRVESLDVRELPPAIADFERAVSLDRRYAVAYAGLASAEFAAYETTRGDNQPDRHRLDRAIAHARHAVSLDEGLAEAHATLGLLLVSAWHTSDASAAARRAVTLEPSNWRHLFRLGHASWGDARLRAGSGVLALYPEFAFTHFQMAMVHIARGRTAEAETVLRQGAAVQDRQSGRAGRFPALGLHWLLGLTRLADDDVEEALAEFDHELQLADVHRLYGREFTAAALHGRGLALLRVERWREAANSFRQALEQYAESASSRIGLAYACRGAGDDPAANDALTRAENAVATMAGGRPVEVDLCRAQLLSARGAPDAAVERLGRLLTDAPPGFAGWTLPIDPLLRPLHGHPGFAGVLARLAERAV